MTDEEFLYAFEACTLSYQNWTHRAHVKVAYLYLRRDGWAQAVEAIRKGIQRYNQSQNVEEGPTSGYNETTTIAFLKLVHATMVVYGDAIPVSNADEFCDAHPQLMNRHVLRFFYSPARRATPNAKHQFVEPDLAPLPDPDRRSQHNTAHR